MYVQGFIWWWVGGGAWDPPPPPPRIIIKINSKHVALIVNVRVVYVIAGACEGKERTTYIVYNGKSTLTRVCNLHSSSVDGVFHE